MNMSVSTEKVQLIQPIQPYGANTLNPIRPLYALPPTPGEAVSLAPGLWWLRLPLSSVLDHINVYVLDNGKGWTLVDTGSNTPLCRAAVETAFAQPPFAHQPLTHVIATHYHPDHVGLAGWLGERGAILQTTRTCWLQSCLLQSHYRTVPGAEEIRFMEQAGLKAMELAAFCRRPPTDYAQLVTPLPASYERIVQGDCLSIGDRQWTVEIGNGHAAEHATLWSNDGFVITGDQILPGMSSNLSVHPSEPDADLVSEWVASCSKFARLATPDQVCLPGHNIPFTGISTRCEQLISSQSLILNRLLEFLVKPRTAVDCLETVYRRTLKPHERSMMIAETFGFLNHLYKRGLIRRELGGAQPYLWFRDSSVASSTGIQF